MRVTLTVPRKNRVCVECASPAVCQTVTRGDAGAVSRVAAALGIPAERLTEEIVKLTTGPVEFDYEPRPVEKFTIRVRRIAEPADRATEFSDADPLLSLRAALDYDAEIVEWSDRSRLAVLDVDYHDRELSQRPDELWLRNAAARLQPAPALYWLSKGRGVHAVYSAHDPYTADELAACAGLSWLGMDGSATFDLCRSTRFPPGEVIQGAGTCNVDAVKSWLGRDVAPDAIDDWLADNDYERGRSYEHDRCPVQPGATSHGTPVFVGDAGIHCHKCASLGVTAGSRKPGYFPYSALTPGGAPSILRTMVHNFTHWEHAGLVIADRLGLTGEKAELAYRAALKLYHGQDVRVSRAFTAGKNLIRLPERWTTRDALTGYDKSIHPMLAALPACQGPNGKPIQETVTRFTQTTDLTEYGYPPVTPIRGMRLYSHRLGFLNPDRISVVVPSGALRSVAMERYRPRYVPVSRRVADPWAVVSEALPGVRREYVELLIAAKGVAEGQIGIPPNILVCGPTQAGKTTMATLAAALCGDHATEVVWQRSVERFRQAVASGADAGTYVVVNEILKDAQRAGSNAVQALDVFLNMTPDSVSHKMYVGPVALGRLPVCICTETDVPQDLRNDMQIARRFVYVRLRESHPEWEHTLANTIGTVQQFRCSSERHAAAADAIVSEVIDRFFDRPRRLAEIAAELGFPRLVDSPDFDDPTEELRGFFKAVCEAPPLDESHAKRWPGRGWKLIPRTGETPLTQAWEALCDSPTHDEKWSTSRRCNSQDWRRILGVTEEVRFELRVHHKTLAVRFKSGGHTDYKVNEELTQCVST